MRNQNEHVVVTVQSLQSLQRLLRLLAIGVDGSALDDGKGCRVPREAEGFDEGMKVRRNVLVCRGAEFNEVRAARGANGTGSGDNVVGKTKSPR